MFNDPDMQRRAAEVEALRKRANDPSDPYTGGHADHISDETTGDEPALRMGAPLLTAASRWLPGVDRTRETSDHGTAVRKTRMAVLHHGALTSLDYLLDLMQPGGRTVSANEGIKDGERVGAVPIYNRAYSLSDAYWDTQAATAECCNSRAGEPWPLSDATHESAAQFVAEAAMRDGWWPHRDGDPKTWTVIDHGEVYIIHGGSYPTACAGGMDMPRVTKRAQQIIIDKQNGDDEMALTADEIAEAVWKYNLRNNINSRKGDNNPEGEDKTSDAGILLSAVHEDAYSLVNGHGVREQIVGALTDEKTVVAIARALGSGEGTPLAVETPQLVEALQRPEVTNAIAEAFALRVANGPADGSQPA